MRNYSPPFLTLLKVAVHLRGGRGGGCGGGGIRGGGGVEMSTGGSPHDVDIIQGYSFFKYSMTLGLQNDLVLIQQRLFKAALRDIFFTIFA